MADFEWVDISQVKPNPKNPNVHSPAQIERLCELIKAYGWRHPIIVSKQTGLVVVGHGRLEAAARMKEDKVPVHYQDFKDETEEYGFMVADNGIANWAELNLAAINAEIPNLGPDFDINLLGIRDFELEPADKYADKDADEVPEVKESFVKSGELWILGNHRLLCGDSTKKEDVERLMNGEKANFCFTSPPYGDQRDYSGNLILDPKHLSKFLEAPCELFAVNLGLQRKDGRVFRYWDDYLEKAESLGLPLVSWNVWDKGECGSIGNQKAMFGISHEWIFVFGQKRELNRTVPNKSAGELANHIWNRQKDGSIVKQKDRMVADFSQLKTVLQCTPQKERDDIDHPARFPVRFAEAYLEACCDSQSAVFEPFCGSGSTLIACEKTNRRCFGMEIDPHYVTVILERWAKFTGKDPIRESDGLPLSEIKKLQVN